MDFDGFVIEVVIVVECGFELEGYGIEFGVWRCCNYSVIVSLFEWWSSWVVDVILMWESFIVGDWGYGGCVWWLK